MKSLLIAAILILSGAVNALATTEVDEVVNSSCTITMVLVSSTTPTRLDSDANDVSPSAVSNLMSFRKVIDIQNQDTSNALRVGFSSSTAVLGQAKGRFVPANYASWTVNARARDQDKIRIEFWGLSTGALVVQSTVAITQCGSK